MDINKLLEGRVCECGRAHKCDIEHIYVESGATSRLAVLCEKYAGVLIVADENTYAAAGEKAASVLGEKLKSKVIFSGKTLLIPNECTADRVCESLDGADLILGVGSGVIQDLCKYVSYIKKIPYMVLATAPSMDGYASSGAAMILNGMKETVAAGLPRAIVADTDVLKEAPLEMIKAGYGDIVGKYSALCDWKLSACVNDEYFCNYIYDNTFSVMEKTLKTAGGLLKRREESIKSLTEALLAVGIMMSFAGSSRPASGSEHHLSHFFEITGIINSEEYFSHGIDVAYSTVITAKIRERILKNDFPDKLYRFSREEYLEKMNGIYKSVAPGCVALQDKTGNYGTKRLETYLKKEKEIKEILAEMPSADEVEKLLGAVGMEMADFYNAYGNEKINNAVAYAKDLKDRYTVLWLYYDLFGEWK